MMTDGYPFFLEKKDTRGADDLMEYVLQYRFESSKSHHVYIARVERYVEHTYCVKFYEERNAYSHDKYSMRSDTFEPRTIFYTLMNIMLDVYGQDDKASFLVLPLQWSVKQSSLTLEMTVCRYICWSTKRTFLTFLSM